MTEYLALKQELAYHLVQSGLTYSIEDEKPPTLRPVQVNLLLDTLLDYMIGAGYASSTKSR
jgi:hypothetical protein